jgi:hypothetical protein
MVTAGGNPVSTAKLIGYIRGTTTTTGLAVKAYLDDRIYKKGQKITRDDVLGLALERHAVCSDWNYTIRPRKNGSTHP